jgi:hypothetical protein
MRTAERPSGAYARATSGTLRRVLLRALACLACAALGLAGADEGDLHLRLALHGRYTARRNTPRTTLLYDRAAQAFDLGPYLRTTGAERYGSTLASAGVEWRHGRFRGALSADTGELRETAFPEVAPVCFAETATGLDVVGSGSCDTGLLRGGPRFATAVEETRLGASRITSNGRPFEEEASSTLLLRDAFAEVPFGRNDFALVKVGRARFTVGDGFIYDDWATGVEAALDLGAIGPSWDLGASLFYPTRDLPDLAGTTPMLALRVDYLPSLFERAGAFLALYRDRTNGVVELFRGALAESSVVRLLDQATTDAARVTEERILAAVMGAQARSDATLLWIGTSGDLRVAPRIHLEWTGAIDVGRLTLHLPTQDIEGDAFGQLAHVLLRAQAWREVELGAFFLFLSGDLPPTEKSRRGVSPRYDGFLGVAPFVTTTNIFFNGGVSESFASRQATAPGVNGRGVIAPGVTASWDPARSFGVDARAAYLLADEVGPFGGRVYGPELDLELSWSPAGWIAFAAEGDVLFPGSFFAGRRPVTKVVLGVDLGVDLGT